MAVNDNPLFAYLNTPRSNGYNELQRVLGADQIEEDPDDEYGGYSMPPSQSPTSGSASADLLRRDAETGTARSAYIAPPTSFQRDANGFIKRNNARVARLRQQFGLGADDGSISQMDLEGEDQAMQDQAFAVRERQAQQALSMEKQKRQQALADWMDPKAAQQRKAMENYELRKVLSAHPPQPGKPDIWGRITTAPGLMASDDPEAPIRMGGGRQRGGGGTDVFGNNGMPEGDQFTDPRTGQHIAPTSQSQDLNERIRDLTADLPPEWAARVEGLVNYRIPYPVGTALNKEEWQIPIARALMIDPKFSVRDYETRMKTAKGYASGGTDKANIDSLNTVLQHLKEFDEAARGLGNVGPFPGARAVNWLKNELEDWGAVGRQETFKGVRTAVSGELGKAFHGTGAVPLETVNRWRETLNRDNSQEGYDAVMKEILDLISGRIGAMQRSYERGMGRSFAPIRDELINGEGRKFLQDRGNSQIYNPEPNVPGVSNPAIDTPPDGRPRKRIRGGGTAVFDNGQWRKE